MDARKEELLIKIIDQYVATASPVSSGLLVDRYHLDCSSATVRNDMATLEEEGLIYQPHTSAGRVPTEEGYRFYLQQVKPAKLSTKIENDLREAFTSSDVPAQSLKATARQLSDHAGETVIVAWGEHDVYYTGIAHLFAKPEFGELEAMRSMSAVIDHFDTVVTDLLARLSDEPLVLIGSENPFSELCSAIGFRYELGPHDGAVMLLGPLRMQYAKNLSLMNYVSQMIDQED